MELNALTQNAVRISPALVMLTLRTSGAPSLVTPESII